MIGGMNLRELLLWGVVGWTALGALGVSVSLVRREREKALRGVAWIFGIWVVYLATVVTVSLVQPQRVVVMGQEQCFEDLCFAVVVVDEVPGFLIRDGSRLVRVSVRVRNRGRSKTQSDGLMQAYLVDGQGRRWEESAGVSGVRLTARVAAGDSVVSEPIFKIASDAKGLGLVFTRGRRQPGLLVIGDSDSWLHRRTVVKLGR
jgi:hypothetical protein